MDQPAERRYAFEVIYGESLLRDAVRTYIVQRFVVEQKRLWLLTGLMVIMTGYFAWKEQAAWLIAVAAGASLLAPLLVSLGWWVHLSNTREALARMGVPRASVAFRDDAMELASDAGKGELPWRVLTEVWERPGYWMFFTGKNRFNILPRANVPEDAAAFFRERTRAILKRM